MTNNRFTEYSKFTWVIPILIGIAAFVCVVGPRALNPTNIAWLGRGDQATMYLGWLFFRQTEWSLPPGLNPNYGLEFSNAIVYSDSIPLLALLFKPFSSWLPEVFQYFGLWILGCFILQSWFAWKILGLFSRSTIVCLFGTLLLTFSPPMIWRLHPYIGHLSLVGHFLILAGIYSVFRPERRNRLWCWLILLAITALVHAYLLVMLLLLWFADRHRRFSNHEMSQGASLLELMSVGCVVGIVCWLSGYFSVKGHVSSLGYGFSQVNLLALFDPGRTDYGLWSAVLPNLPDDPMQHEGFNFLGLGVICLLPFALYSFWVNSSKINTLTRKYRAVCIVLVVLFLFSVSNNLSVGSWTLSLPINDTVLLAANVFRASARMFWPVYYFMLIVIFYLIIRGYGTQFCLMLFAVASLIQIVDTSSGWLKIRAAYMQPSAALWTTTMVSPFWEAAAKRYTKVRRIPLMYNSIGFEPIPYYAGTHNMATDGVYLNRIDTEKLAAAEQRAIQAIEEGTYEPDALYIVDAETFAKASKHADRNTTFLEKVDGFYVIGRK